MSISRGTLIASLASLVAIASCTSRAGLPDGGGPTSSSASSSSASGGSSGSAGGSSSGAGSSTSSGAGSGSTTGPLPSPYFDGGYVFCAATVADAGLQRWMCQPGTYFCDTGASGVCFQCRDDSDCADSSLPTYDPRRPRCDLDSGVSGYQGFCQQCLVDTDCAGNPEGTFCDLDPNFPADAVQPPIETIGFEACGQLETDCRRLDGPLCREFDEHCNQRNGRCESGCTSDQDCVESFGSEYVLAPFCVDGTCQSCDGGCFYGQFCLYSDAECGNPASLPTGLICDFGAKKCVCTESSQCGGFWPVCLGFDGGLVTPGGQPAGLCGCDSTAECGDGGLVCMPTTTIVVGTPFRIDTGVFGGAGACGVLCTSPIAPGCNAVTQGQYDSCEPTTGLCTPCVVEDNCLNSLGSGGPVCTSIFVAGPPPSLGTCTCLVDSDCPYGYLCGSGGCGPVLPRCTDSSCGSGFCDFATGLCSQDAGAPPKTGCISNYECPPEQVCVAGECVGCVTDADCLILGPSDATLCCGIDADCYDHRYLENTCAPYCHSDADCVGNTNGSQCELDAGPGSVGTYMKCGCAADADCAQNPIGLHCDSDSTSPQFGVCGCLTSSDCAADEYCTVDRFTPPGTPGSCASLCQFGAACPVDFPCGPSGSCQPRCDGRYGCPASAPLCDLGNAEGLNGTWAGDLDAGDTIWCYQCLDSRDCGSELGGGPGAGLGCHAGTCASCTGSGDCFAGTVCAPDGLCHATCDAGTCAHGQACDVVDQVGGGSNVCYECLSPVDCPDGQGCDSKTHTCGTCEGPFLLGGPYDCPPDAICSNYRSGGTGVCLQNCDREPCQASAPLCTVFPALTPDHSYCFGCLSDLDCEDGGWCDVSVERTYSCKKADEP